MMTMPRLFICCVRPRVPTLSLVRYAFLGMVQG